MPRTKGSKNKPVEIITDVRKFELDPWQIRVLNHKGNIVLRTGRQVGKSTIVALKTRKLAYEYPGTTTMVVAASQRQAALLYEKIRAMLELDNQEVLEKAMKGKSFSSLKRKREWEKDYTIFRDEPTMTRIRLKNGSEIYCLPTGKTGAYIRGFTIDFFIPDEAARIPNEVFIAVEPSLLASKKKRNLGWIIALSTPKGAEGWFYDVCHDKDFLQIHITSEKCKRLSQKELKKKKKKLTALQYGQEYLAEFIEGFRRYFKDAILKKLNYIDTWSLDQKDRSAKYFLGVDVARFGRDDNAFVVAEIKDKNIKIVKAEVSNRKDLMDTAGKIIELDKKFNFFKIYIDATGVGGGVVDVLREDYANVGIKRKIVETHNISRQIAEDKTIKTLKEDMYSNCLIQMENQRVTLLNDKALLFSLKSISFDYTSFGTLKIFGKSTHLTEALVRACWGIKYYKRFFVL